MRALTKGETIRLARDLKALLTGGFVANDQPNENPYEHTAMYMAAAQLKAIHIAIAEPDPEPPEEGGGGWCRFAPFTKHDAIAAIAGVAAYLDAAREVVPFVREYADESETP